MDCQLDAVFTALAGGEVADARMVAPPFRPRSAPPPPGTGKPTYGDDLRFHVDSANFTVQWSSPSVDADVAAAISTQLEAGWTALVDEQGWPAPVSTDTYRLWVVLDPDLGGSGFTTTYRTDEYPEGYPVVYVNPGYSADTPEFARSVAVHEFSHAIQYGTRSWAPGAEESWYWEASAEWMAELGAPELDTYAWSSYWYATQPWLAWNSGDGAHQYGMLLFEAWLAEYVGDDVVMAAWTANEGEPWADVLPRVAGRDLPGMIREMSGVYLAHALRESDLYYDPGLARVDGPGDEDAVGELGTFYYAVDPGDLRYVLEGDVVAAYVGDGGPVDVAPDGPFDVAVTTRSATGSFSWRFVEPGDITGPGDTAGAGDTAATDTGDGKAVACGCVSGGAPGAPWAPAGAALLALATTRRRGRATPR